MKIFLPLALAAAEKYDGYKVFRASWYDPVVSETVEKLLTNSKTVDLWKPESIDLVHDTREVDFMISSEEADNIARLFRMNQISVETMIEDAGELITEQANRPIQTSGPGQYSFTEYLDWPALEEWITQLPEQFPGKVSLENRGQTENGRNLLALTFNGGGDGKKDIFMECGIHAREWISSASCRYFINEMLNSATNDDYVVDESLPYTREDLAALYNDFNWFIFPAMNPDGYSYTHTNDRMWRKNRGSIQGSQCTGVDLNRQFPVGHLTTGGSSSPCASTYASVKPLDQNETIEWDRLAKEVKARGNLAAAISVHSYSQLLMPPWATGKRQNEKPQDPETIDYLMSVTNKMGEAISNTHGKVYKVGQSRDVVGYAAGGTTEDYAYDKAPNGFDIPLAWVYELRDTGRYGFLLPPEQIQPTSEEVINSFVEMAKELRNPTGPN